MRLMFGLSTLASESLIASLKAGTSVLGVSRSSTY
jgi:hypothetical protein